MKLKRSTFVRGVLILPVLAGGIGTAARADGKTPQAAVQYQGTPSGDKQCSECTYFIPGDTASANGTCKLVDGTISPNGYCVAYTRK